MTIDVDLKDLDGLFAPVAAPSATAAKSTSMLRVGGATRPGGRYVLETRRLLEIEIAGLAASHCTPDDIDRLAQTLEEVELSRTDPERFPQAEHDFHMALAEATQNVLYPSLLDLVADISPAAPGLGCQGRCRPAQVLAFCRAVFDQVAAGDAEGARHAMRGYVDQTVYAIEKALAGPEPSAHPRG